MNGPERAERAAEIDAAIDAAITAWLARMRSDLERRRREHPPSADHPGITCPVCSWTSYHPEDIRYGYCGWCHAFTSPPGGNNPAPVS